MTVLWCQELRPVALEAAVLKKRVKNEGPEFNILGRTKTLGKKRHHFVNLKFII
jgi:hypothetical protein